MMYEAVQRPLKAMRTYAEKLVSIVIKEGYAPQARLTAVPEALCDEDTLEEPTDGTSHKAHGEGVRELYED